MLLIKWNISVIPKYYSIAKRKGAKILLLIVSTTIFKPAKIRSYCLFLTIQRSGQCHW